MPSPVAKLTKVARKYCKYPARKSAYNIVKANFLALGE
jgi:hypothetical protein